MASVWLARLKGKHGFEKLVALKTILPSLAEDKRFRRMLLAEAKIASRIEHVNVAQTLDLGEQDGHLYLVMEWVDGDSLSKLDYALQRASQSMPLPILLRVMVEACAGLHAAHELCDDSGSALGVVHRDVSPQNILVSVKGQTKLIDFGIAKAQVEPSEETRAGILKGKLNYMPPEQALRRPVDRRTDVWAVGAVLYRMLSRRTPYESPSPVTSLRLLTSHAPPAPLPEEIDAELAALVLQALSPNPAHRPSTALELQGELERLAAARDGLATSQELASFVTTHLGQTLQDRRDKISRALRSATERDTVVLPLGPGSDSASGLKDTKPDMGLAATLEPDTGATGPSVSSTAVTLQMSSRAPEPLPRKPWVAGLVAAALLGVGVWSLSGRPAALSQVDTATHKSAVTPASSELASEAAPAPPAAAPAEPAGVSDTASEPAPISVDQLLPAPVMPSALPLSAPTPARPSKAPAPKVASKAPKAAAAKPQLPSSPAPKRKIVDDGF